MGAPSLRPRWGAEGAETGLKIIECQEKMNHQGKGGEGGKDILIA